MAKSDDARSRKRAGKNVDNKVVEDMEDDSNTGPTECVPPPEPTGETGDVSIENTEAAIEQEMEGKGEDEAKDEQDSQMDTPAPVEEKPCTPSVTVSWETDKSKEGEVNGKRRAESDVETSPSKKAKTINDGFCLFVGNLNKSKTFEEIKDSLANYFMAQSLLVQDIRLDHSRKFAYVDMASEMDLTKALTLNRETILEKPMRIAKATVKNKDKVKAQPKDQKAKDARCLFVKNLPFTTTKEDILKTFHKAVAVRFPGGTEGPSEGIAFVEFNTEAIAEQVRKNKQGKKIQDRVLVVGCVGEKGVHKTNKAPAELLPTTTLFVKNLAYKVTEKTLKKVFKKAVSIKIPQSQGKSRGFAFVEFGTIDDAKKALEKSQNVDICQRQIKIKYCETRAKPRDAKVVTKTLIVVGLAEKTSKETLKSAFEGAVSAAVVVNKTTGVCMGFGFVNFMSIEDCKAAKEAMEDCVIDGRNVTLSYAKPKVEGGIGGGVAGEFQGRPGDRGRRGKGGRLRGGRGSRGGRGCGCETTAQDDTKGGGK